MELLLICFCLLTGTTSVVSLLYAITKSEGLRSALCVLISACMAVITVMTVCWM